MFTLSAALQPPLKNDAHTTPGQSSIKPCFPLGDFFRAKRLFPLSASLITSANAMPTKEKVGSREKSRLVENGL